MAKAKAEEVKEPVEAPKEETEAPKEEAPVAQPAPRQLVVNSRGVPVAAQGATGDKPVKSFRTVNGNTRVDY